MAEEDVNVNVNDLDSASNGDQEVEDMYQLHEHEVDHPKICMHCNGISHAINEKEDADGSSIFVSGSEEVAAAADGDPRVSDLNDDRSKSGEIVDDNGESLTDLIKLSSNMGFKDIKQLKQREELSFVMGKRDQLQPRLDQKDSIEDHFKASSAEGI
ncbi:hypothetical protein L6164_015166 [Bauhinia variegata]|uniref:Uncharacterized protein n=1 Tax=Bauhinia variegata TaxID=167791 RepID=A0ACB9NLH4_BAUVA|nr:hypothetical protein L6164_015166 [Bauhinia variegata]